MSARCVHLSPALLGDVRPFGALAVLQSAAYSRSVQTNAMNGSAVPTSPPAPPRHCAKMKLGESRKLGPTEASYYLGARGDGLEGGVNDMYLHIGFRARTGLVTKERVLDVWSEILHRHALLCATAEFRDYTEIHFRTTAKESVGQKAHTRAQELCMFESGRDASAIISSYLNGPRTLSDHKLSQLLISSPVAGHDFSGTRNGESHQDFDFFLFSTHYLGDGMALHSTAHEFFSLLSQTDRVTPSSHVQSLPPPMEAQLETGLVGTSRLADAVARIDFKRSQAKQIGGHAFPKARLGPRHTLVPTVSYPPEDTKRALAACKAHGVSIANAMFALSSLAFIRSVEPERRRPELPIMLYSALNVRPYLKMEEANKSDWYHLAIGYYNIILPSFVPTTTSASDNFWHHAESVKKQTTRVLKSPFLASRTLLMAKRRESQSVGWEREADEKRKREATGVQCQPTEDSVPTAGPAETSIATGVPSLTNGQVSPEALTGTGVPQPALMGLSMLGNLDGIYKHAEYDGIELCSLTTGSRQRPGALLLFAYTFAGKLWISLGYDSNGFEAGAIESWWRELLSGVDEFLLAQN
ncbi:hypothetical protein JCM3774_000211 [Rhodotorula dairenensis]